MKRTTHLLTLSTVVLATIIITMIASPANGSKRSKTNAIESSDIAFVDVFKLVDLALSSEEMVKVRDEFNVKASESMNGMQQQLQTLQTKMSTMSQDDPEAAASYNQFQQLQGQLNNLSQQISDAYQTLIATQISDGYTEIYAAANEIGTQQGFTFVFSTRTTGELIQTDTITGITQEILARPLMTPQPDTDLTELVRVKLGYPEKAPVAETDDKASDKAGAEAGAEAGNETSTQETSTQETTEPTPEATPETDEND